MNRSSALVLTLAFGACFLGVINSSQAQLRASDFTRPGALTRLLEHKDQEPLTGAWIGHYECSDESHPVIVKLTEGIRGRVKAEFHALYQSDLYSSFKLKGSVTEGKKRLRLKLTPSTWIERALPDLIMIGLRGQVNGEFIRGKVQHKGCGRFEVHRMGCDLTPESPCSREDRDMFSLYLKRGGELRERRIAQRRPVESRRATPDQPSERHETRRTERRETRRTERSETRRTERRDTRPTRSKVRVFEGERCPKGWRYATYRWVSENKEAACHAQGMGESHIARIAGGGSQDGWGYKCRNRRSDKRKLKHLLCVEKKR